MPEEVSLLALLTEKILTAYMLIENWINSSGGWGKLKKILSQTIFFQ